MKGFTKLLSLILCLTLLLCFPVSASAKTRTKTIFNSKTYTHQSKFDGNIITQGVDLSVHNGSVNFASLKKAGVKYVILRAGVRGYGKKGTISKDKKFDEYIKAAAKQNLDIGVYFYSQAITENEAKTEANFTLNVIKQYKEYITLPVAFDYEFADVSSGRFDSAWRNKKVNKTKCTKIARVFCDTVEKAGYDPMIYANKSFLENTINGKELDDDYTIWIAHYTTSTSYSGNYDIWQFSSTGKVNGVSGNVDCNFMYEENRFSLDHPLATMAHTGKALEPALIVKYGNKILKKDRDYILTYKNNTNIGTATVTVNGINDYESVRDANFHFNIVPKKASAPVLEDRDMTFLTVKWNKSDDDIDGYMISCADGKNVHHVLTSSKNASASIPKLDSAKNYNITVQSYKTVGKKNYYGFSSNSLKACTKPAKVSGLKAKSQGHNYINLTWNKQGNAERYIVYKYNSKSKKYNKYKEVSTNLLKVTGLGWNSSNSFMVSAVKKDENGKNMFGQKSNALTCYTTPVAPKISSAKSNKKKKITVKHAKIPNTSGYQVEWSTYKNFKHNTKTQTFSGGSYTTNTVSAARSRTTYYVRVRSYRTRNGKRYYSVWSGAKKVKTK